MSAQDVYTLLNKYDLKADGLQTEEHLNKKHRSYIHYLLDDPELVSVKCNCVEWLFQHVGKVDSVIEFMAGAGCASVILRDLCQPSTHQTLELSPECVAHLENNGFKSQVGDVKKTPAEYVDGWQFKIVDYPFGTIVTNTRGDWKNFLDVFKGDVTQYVSWTDSAGSYPVKIHGKTYAEAMGTDEVFSDWEDYFRAYSKWLYEQTGFSIVRVARRKLGNKFGSCFVLAEKGDHATEFKIFQSEECGDDILLNGEPLGEAKEENSLW